MYDMHNIFEPSSSGGKVKTASKKLLVLLVVGLLIATSVGTVFAQENPIELPDVSEFAQKLQDAAPPALLEDGTVMANAVPPLIMVADPNPGMKDIRVAQEQEVQDAINGVTKAGATFQITYVAAGGTDNWGEPCYEFPAAAKSAFNAAAAIWANTIQSSVPVTIRACWANLGSSSILGYSGGAYGYRDFSGAPISGTWYESSLANALHGSDLGSSYFDDHITYNSNFSWYYGTDGNTPSGQYDLVTVAAHEIAHGLNFSGSAYVSGSYGYWGSSGYPYIYDRFMEDSGGTKLISYSSGSTALAGLLTGNALYWNGTNANSANGGSRPKMFAPSSWMGGSSYSHLDYNTFAGTSNSMMVYAVSSGSSQHNPGNVTKGIFKDMGWNVGTVTPTVPTPVAPSGTITDTTPTFKWTKIKNATKYEFRVYKGTSTSALWTKTAYGSDCGTTYCTKTITTALTAASYKWQARAYVNGAWKAWSAKKSFTVSSGSTGFNSQFTSNASGWTPVNGKWIVGSGYYQTAGVSYKHATTKHSDSYGVLTYTVKMKRTGCSYCSNSIWFNGSPSPITGTGEWNNGYFFGYSNTKYYIIGMMKGGTWTPLISEWTYSSAISSTGWNTIKVTYNKNTGFVQIFINGTRVGYGSLNTFKTGQVGIGLYKESDSSKLLVDFATLTTTAPKSVSTAVEGIYFDDTVEYPNSDINCTVSPE